jgi:hypothetical protein
MFEIVILFLLDPPLDTSNAFVPRPNSNFIKGTLHYLGTILMNTSPSNIKCSKQIFSNRNIINGCCVAVEFIRVEFRNSSVA